MDMTVGVEVWPVAADEDGFWLLDADAWRTATPVQADSGPQAEAELLLAMHGVPVESAVLALLHSTSWRDRQYQLMVTYVAAVNCTGPVLEHWPSAMPLSMEVQRQKGFPAAHGPSEAPDVRELDVLFHALRHLSFLNERDAVIHGALNPAWRGLLRDVEPQLARMYGRDGHRSAAA